MKAPAPSEEIIHRALIAHLTARAKPGVVWLHVPNGGSRNKHEAAKLKGMGVVAGMPDLLLFHDSIAYALELKADRGKLRPSQVEQLDRLKRAGVCTAVTYGLDDALARLMRWSLLR